jgi:low temperature requirement protein LtrA
MSLDVCFHAVPSGDDTARGGTKPEPLTGLIGMPGCVSDPVRISVGDRGRGDESVTRMTKGTVAVPVTEATTASLMRSGDSTRVTYIELFFDLVYVLAVTQLSHHLLGDLTLAGGLQTALLLVMVWLLWVYTAWLTNWLDPEQTPVRLSLLALMFVSLGMSAGLPEAFGSRGWWIGAAYATSQIGRSAVAVAAMWPHEPMRRNFERILVWCCGSGALAVLGGLCHGYARAALWLGAVAVDLGGSVIGFYTPGLGRSSTIDWPLAGAHFAERCEAFILIALGESIVVIGSTLSALHHIGGAEVGAFAAVFAGSVALWLIYFDRSAAQAGQRIASSPDPGRLGRSAYHQIHPVMVAGIIVSAAADDRVLTLPARADHATDWLILGGSGLFLAGHAAFKAVMWRVVPWSRLAGIAALALLGVVATSLPVAVLAAIVAVVVILVAVVDRITHPEPLQPS